MVADKTFLMKWRHMGTAAERRALRQGKILVPPRYTARITTIDINTPLSWSAFANFEETFKFWINNCKFLRPCFSFTNRSQGLSLLERILFEWVQQNPMDNPATDRAWDGHATGIRAEILSAAWTAGIKESWLAQTIAAHAEFLAISENYQGKWNHGLDQSLGLFALGIAIDREDWIKLATSRIFDILEALVDSQGVAIEQAVDYQEYVYLQILHVISRFQSAEISLPPELETRVNKMPLFLAHALQPNGILSPLGDSRGAPLHCEAIVPTVEYSATQGHSGLIPDANYVIYDAGYVFWRSGWGENTSFENEIHYTLRYGPARIIHGHNDHTSITYYSNGQEIIIDPGFDGYTPGPFRDYFRSPAAHNVAYCREAKFLWNAYTYLVNYNVFPSWQSYYLQDAPHPNTNRKRCLLFVQSPLEVICIMDFIQGNHSCTYQQYWHFHHSLRPEVNNSHIRFGAQGFDVNLFQTWPIETINIIQGETNPIAGWASSSTPSRITTPTVITTRNGIFASFLTVIVFSKKNAICSVTQRPLHNKERKLIVSDGRTEAHIKLTKDGFDLISQ